MTSLVSQSTEGFFVRRFTWSLSLFAKDGK